MMRPLISARSSVENTARRRPTATISSAILETLTAAVGILASRLVPNNPGPICFHNARPPQPAAPRIAAVITSRRINLTVWGFFGGEAMES